MTPRATRALLAGSLLIPLAPMPLNAQSWKKELIQKIEETYKPTDRSFWNLDNVNGGGTVMVLVQGGVIATLSSDNTYWETRVREGNIHTEGTTSRSTSRLFQKGEKVFILSVKVLEDEEDKFETSHFDIIRLMILSTGTSQRQEGGSTTERRYKGALAFQFPVHSLRTADFAELKKAMNGALVSETEFQVSDSPATVRLGMTPQQVEGLLGKPQKVIDLGSKKLYVYPDIKVTFVEGLVTDVQ